MTPRAAKPKPGAAKSAPAAPVFFATPAAFRAWLRRHGATATELVVGFHKVDSGRPSITWPQSVDEALCEGWIDGVRRRIDDTSYQIRFTPRKASSHWSAVNIERVRVLTGEGRMRPAGLAAFARRTEERSRRAAYEQQAPLALTPAEEKRFRAHRAAWAFFEQQPAGYRKRMLWWIVSAKKPETRERRLAAVIAASENGKRL